MHTYMHTYLHTYIQGRQSLSADNSMLDKLPESEREYATDLRNKVIEQEARESVLLSEKAAAAEECAALRGELNEAV